MTSCYNRFFIRSADLPYPASGFLLSAASVALFLETPIDGPVETKLREHRHRGLPEATAESSEVLRCSAGGASVRLLLVDDNEDDRAIALRELNRDFPELAVTQVSCAESLEV